MKPFNIEEAKKGKPVTTRDGRPVKIIYWDRKGSHPIVALVGEDEDMEVYGLEGNYHLEGKSSLDLVMASIKKERWINLYRLSNGSTQVSNTLWNTEEGAVTHSYNSLDRYITTIKIEWEE